MPQPSRSSRSKFSTSRSLPSSNLQEKMLSINQENPHQKVFLISTSKHTIKAICIQESWSRRWYMSDTDIKRVYLRFKQISRKEDGHLFKGAEFYISNVNPLTNTYFNDDRTKFYILSISGDVSDEVLNIKSSSFGSFGGRKKTYRKSSHT